MVAFKSSWVLMLLPTFSAVAAESLNVDIGVTGGVPANTYAAAGNAGSWNGIPIPVGDLAIAAPNLVNLSGVTTDVSLNILRTLQDGETVGWGTIDRYPSPDAHRLLHDQINTFLWLQFSDPYGTVFEFEGLDEGRYDVITYTTPTAVANIQSIVTINDDPSTAQQVAGTFRYPFSELTEGVTHVIHRNVPVDASGLLRVLAHSTLQSDSSFVNGFQLMPASVICDFDNDSQCRGSDADALVAAIVSGSDATEFDLTGDGTVDSNDLFDADLGWLRLAGEQHLGAGRSYLRGDANLDGVVDGQDFVDWNQNRFTMLAAWTAGDWNADGVIDASDFIVWNENKFTMADGPVAVPDPSSGLCGALLLALVTLTVQGRRESRFGFTVLSQRR